MKAAIVTQLGQPPEASTFDAPSCKDGEVLVHVRAAAISQLVRARASGTHYSFDGHYPFIPGVDGVGTLPDGTRVYFAFPAGPFGAMAEQVAVPRLQCVTLPDGLDDISAAALANPGMSSWIALKERAGLHAGESVLINGATGASGMLAVQIAKHLGASHIIATGRNVQKLAHLKTLGADETIQLTEDATAMQKTFSAALDTGADVILDYLWGPSARALLEAASHALPHEKRRRFVQIGSQSGAEISLPGGWLRSCAIELMGSGLGSVPTPKIIAAIGEMLQLAADTGIRIPTQAHPLSALRKAWADTGSDMRQVITFPETV
ncbi:zinc-binding alcohol dehydrogenase family protein [Thioclava litoralis]|uniref:Zinc-binding alcohol dehydrogenase family protein n=1 Tax=Thioclava litoralis TaxID=3076557 RepID=A0ABZ1DXA9_9RHOB|nr:zinc-binding alcohol dehydrogenase family protein [Thioclava sp. FTW29]